MKKTILFISLFMAMLTTSLIFIFLYAIPYSIPALELISLLSIVGYLSAAIYYKQYKSLK